jgi:malonyl CoA-acyl carrier protein transacylase
LPIMAKGESITPLTGLFPGQGGIKPGIGQEAWEKSTEAKKVFFLASAQVGVDLAEVAFGSQTDLIEEQSQMVRTAASIAEFEYAKERGLKISGAGGHSLGQLAAFYAVGAISRPDILELTHSRQEAMQYSNSINPGLMVAVTGIPTAIASKLAGMAKARHANENASDQHTFSGPIEEEGVHIEDRVKNAVSSLKDEIEAIARGEKKIVPRIRVRLLGKETGGAHHRELQAPGVPMFAEDVARLKSNFKHIKPGTLQANSVQWLTSPDDLERELISGLTQGVNWRGQMWEYYQSGYRHFYETASSDVLTNLINRDYKTEVLKKRFGQVVKIIEPKNPLVADNAQIDA